MLAGACSLGIDCDVQTARPNPSGNSVLPANWNFYPAECAIDQAAPNSVLTNAIVRYDPGNLPYYCVAYCDGLDYTYTQAWRTVTNAGVVTECRAV